MKMNKETSLEIASMMNSYTATFCTVFGIIIMIDPFYSWPLPWRFLIGMLFVLAATIPHKRAKDLQRQSDEERLKSGEAWKHFKKKIEEEEFK